MLVYETSVDVGLDELCIGLETSVDLEAISCGLWYVMGFIVMGFCVTSSFTNEEHKCDFN